MFQKLAFIFSFIFLISACHSHASQSSNLGALLNKVRIEHAKHTVRPSEQLRIAAQKHAEDMDINHYFSHTGRNGSSHKQRIKDTGYVACYTAENIAVGQKTPERVIRSWMNSDGHRANNLSDYAQEYGIGKSGKVWVLVLAAGC